MSKTYQQKDINELTKQPREELGEPELLFQELSGQDLNEVEKRQKKADTLKAELKAIKPGMGKDKIGSKYWLLYENICREILETVFRQEFITLNINVQARAPKITGIREIIRDILVSNNHRDGGCKWKELKDKYECQEIVFECKNLKGLVKAQHIFQLFLYLTSGTGRFGIILSRNGKLEESANRAIEKLYQINKNKKEKENYLILVFNDKDLEEMLDNYIYGQTQEQLIGRKLQEHNKNMNF